MAQKNRETLSSLEQDYLFAEMKPASSPRVFPSEPLHHADVAQETMFDADRLETVTLHTCRIAALPYTVAYQDGSSEWRMSVHAPADLWDRQGLELIELRATKNASLFNKKRFQPGQWVDVTGVLQLTQELQIGGTEQMVRFLSVTEIRKIKEPGSGRSLRRQTRAR